MAHAIQPCVEQLATIRHALAIGEAVADELSMSSLGIDRDHVTYVVTNVLLLEQE